MSYTTLPELPPDVGPYRFLQVIGEGGMGVVYEAEQLEPVRRRVAVKMMKVGLDTKEVVGRFEVERQALAVMDHPGIAKVLDGGATEQGRPYFVMELVRGIRIDDYCDQRRLPTRARIELFIQVCEAVQHAHQKGVIHRDLKPSNVLVTEEGGRPLPKVIDFGVAKATGWRLSEETFVTTYGQALGTLAYMSPEQAEMSGLDVDTRADVYSLGVTLYQLLSGEIPSDPAKVGGPTFLAELISRDHSMPTLARHLSTMSYERLSTIAALRATDRAGLRKQLGGDLQWIVQKAIEKDRSRRYETANGLATDLERYLASEPIAARPPSVRYRASMFVRRNRTGVAAACTVVLALSAGAVTATVGMVRAQRAEARASQEAATAREVSAFLTGMFELSGPDESRGAEITAREILDRGAERISADLDGQPLVQARLLLTMADVYLDLGLSTEAEATARRALELRRGALGESHEDVAAAMQAVGSAVAAGGDPRAALDVSLEALGILEERLPSGDELIGRALTNIGSLQVRLASYSEAEATLSRALAIKEANLAPDDPDIASTLYNLAIVHRQQEQYDTAIALYRRTLAIREEALGADHPAVSRTVNGLGNTYRLLGQYDSAEALYLRSLAEKERTLGPRHPDLANTVNNLAIVYAVQEKVDEANEMFERAYRIRLEALGDQHPDVAESLNNLGIMRRRAGDLVGSAEAFRAAIEIYESVLGPDHPRLAESLENHAETLRGLGRDSEAAAADARAARIREGRASR